MKYYKLINGQTVIGMCSSIDFRVFQKKHRVLLICDETKGQYLQFNDKLYHDHWMLPIKTDTFEYELVDAIEISEEEYSILKDAEQSGKEIIVETVNDESEESEPYVDPINETTVDYIKTKKINELNHTCNRVITNGFDVRLSDNETYHFSLTTQDQLNFISLSAMVSSGESMIPYHADGKLCKFYSAKDINTIISAATTFKTYHLTYFNSLKNYISTMKKIEDIDSVEYGIQIPIEYQSDVLKTLLKK